MRFANPTVQVTVDFTVHGMTAAALNDLRTVMSVGLATARKQRAELHETVRAAMDRRIAVAEEFLKSLDDLEKSMERLNNKEAPGEPHSA